MCSQRVKLASLRAGKSSVGAYRSPCARFKTPDDGAKDVEQDLHYERVLLHRPSAGSHLHERQRQ